ncbi:T9SS C-terminal target domain-containing protein [candidate division KSB1 bacterium]|nr:MAG: T9SS C-terminal target domain-containing protein [candidate division KSB1 bacterium]
MQKYFSLLLSLLLFTIVCSAQAMPLLQSGEPYYEFARHEVLVQFVSKLSGWDMAKLCEPVGAKIVEESAEMGFYRAALPEDFDEARAVAYFRSLPDVEWANFNYLAHVCYTPNDPLYAYQWHYPRMNLPQAWDLTRGNPNIMVAVCDMGYQFNHEDWAGVQTINPRDFIQNDYDPTTNVADSHGEHVAGTIFAATNNNLGVAGVAPLCKLIPIRCMDDSGTGTMMQISNAIAWAYQHDAHVINLSLSIRVTGPPSDPGPPLSTAINNAYNAGTIICAASGNDYQPYVAFPAAYTQCIAIGATGYNDMIAPYSNTGGMLDIVAPGGNMAQDLNSDGYGDGVLSTVRESTGDVYVFFHGTSMATPHVAGLAALLLSYGIQANQVRQALQQTAVDLGTTGLDNIYGWGRVNAYAALRYLNSEPHQTHIVPRSVKLSPPYPNPFNSSTIIPLEISATTRVELTVYNILAQKVTTLLPSQNLEPGSYTYLWNAQDLPSGVYLIKLSTASFEQSQKVLLIK